jgi:FkbM family methyltransferase
MPGSQTTRAGFQDPRDLLGVWFGPTKEPCGSTDANESIWMTFISYAQNFEDVMIWRALKHVERGFYIDVGAAHPDEYSVTRAFYDRGWHGINIEPSIELFARLAAVRERDTNLNLAVSNEPKRVAFFEIPGTGLSTLDATVAAAHRSAGWAMRERTVEQTTLAEVCRECAAYRNPLSQDRCRRKRAQHPGWSGFHTFPALDHSR